MELITSYFEVTSFMVNGTRVWKRQLISFRYGSSAHLIRGFFRGMDEDLIDPDICIYVAVVYDERESSRFNDHTISPPLLEEFYISDITDIQVIDFISVTDWRNYHERH